MSRVSQGVVGVRVTIGNPIVQQAAIAVATEGAGTVLEGAAALSEEMIVVRGGMSELPAAGEVFSGAAGNTLEEAAAGVPHGTIRTSTVGEIRAGGGTVELKPELSRGGVLNERHVDICMGGGPCPFGEPVPNPVPKAGRIQ